MGDQDMADLRWFDPGYGQALDEPTAITRTEDFACPRIDQNQAFTRFEQKRVDGRFDGVFQECAIKQIVDFPGRDPQQQLVEILRNGRSEEHTSEIQSLM